MLQKYYLFGCDVLLTYYFILLNPFGNLDGISSSLTAAAITFRSYMKNENGNGTLQKEFHC